MAQPSPLILGVSGNQFTVNDQPKFLLFVSYFDAMRREANGGVDEDFEYIKASGYDGVRIFPNWGHYPGGQADDDGLFTTGGSLRSSSLGLFHSVLDKAQAYGLLVDVSFTADTYGIPEPDSAFLLGAHRNQLIAITNTLKNYPGGNRHVFFDIQNEWSNTLGEEFETEIAALIDSVRTNDPERLVTVSTGGWCPENPSNCAPEAGAWSHSFGLDINAYHDDRSNNWYQDGKLQQEIAAVRAGIGHSMPIHLQEPKAIATMCPPQCPGQTDTDPDHAFEAAGAAKRYAAGWTFHTRSTFVLDSESFLDKLNQDPLQKWTFEELPRRVANVNPIPSVPGQPTNVTGTPGVGQVEVSFAAPKSNGYSPILYYTVTAQPGGQTASGYGSPVTVTGLTHGTTYEFTVTATNGVGTGDPSDPVFIAPVTPTVTIISPTASKKCPSGGTCLIQAVVSNAPAITRVEFRVNGGDIGNVASQPYNKSWAVGAPGQHTLQARAVFDEGPSVLSPVVTVTANVMMSLDAPTSGAAVLPPFTISGWAIDQNASTGTGVDTVHVWAFPGGNVPGVVIGAATMGGSRPDVAAIYGSQFQNSGWSISVSAAKLKERLPSLPHVAGPWLFVAYAHSTVEGYFNQERNVSANVQPIPQGNLDLPALPANNVDSPFTVAGWAIDYAAATGTGVNTVHVWAYPSGGGSAQFLGVASYGGQRTDIKANYGNNFEYSGYGMTAELSTGTYLLAAFPYSTVLGGFTAAQTRTITVTSERPRSSAGDPPSLAELLQIAVPGPGLAMTHRR